MGWGDCGTDSKGRPIGYSHTATCDHPGCKTEIDRGLSYACGGMHGEDEVYCEGYFCPTHLVAFVESDGKDYRVCAACELALLATGEWVEDEEEGVIQRLPETASA